MTAFLFLYIFTELDADVKLRTIDESEECASNQSMQLCKKKNFCTKVKYNITFEKHISDVLISVFHGFNE